MGGMSLGGGTSLTGGSSLRGGRELRGGSSLSGMVSALGLAFRAEAKVAARATMERLSFMVAGCWIFTEWCCGTSSSGVPWKDSRDSGHICPQVFTSRTTKTRSDSYPCPANIQPQSHLWLAVVLIVEL